MLTATTATPVTKETLASGKSTFIMIWKLIPFLGSFIANILKIVYFNKFVDAYNAQFVAGAPVAEEAEAVEEATEDVVEVAAE